MLIASSSAIYLQGSKQHARGQYAHADRGGRDVRLQQIGGVYSCDYSNIISGITVSSLLAVGIIFGDYVLIRNITGSAFQNVQIFLFLAMKRSSTEASAVFVIIMLTTFLITALFLYVQSRDERQKIEEKGR